MCVVSRGSDLLEATELYLPVFHRVPVSWILLRHRIRLRSILKVLFFCFYFIYFLIRLCCCRRFS